MTHTDPRPTFSDLREDQQKIIDDFHFDFLDPIQLIIDLACKCGATIAELDSLWTVARLVRDANEPRWTAADFLDEMLTQAYNPKLNNQKMKRMLLYEAESWEAYRQRRTNTIKGID